jgi:hypothetical protein
MKIKLLLALFVFCLSLLLGCAPENNNDENGGDPNSGNNPGTSSNSGQGSATGKNAVMPTNQDQGRIREMYDKYMSVYYRTYEDDAPNITSTTTHPDAAGTARIMAAFNNVNDGTRTCSEAMGYGMFLAAVMGDWDRFDKLHAYTKLFHFPETALMRWNILQFDYYISSAKTTGGPATDADLDIAAALIIAHKKTGKQNYLDDAIAIANSIYEHEVHESSKLILPAMKNENWGQGANRFRIGDGNLINISYISLPVLKEFAAHDSKWNEVLEKNLSYMEKVQNNGHLWPDWSDANGDPANPGNGTSDDFGTIDGSAVRSHETYYKEAPRIPWRIAWYYHWYGDPRAKEMLNKGMEFLRSKFTGADRLKDELYNIYVYKTGATSSAKICNVTTCQTERWASLCALGMGSSDNMSYLNTCNEWLKNNYEKSPLNEPYGGYFDPTLSSYYKSSLHLIYAMLFNGMF